MDRATPLIGMAETGVQKVDTAPSVVAPIVWITGLSGVGKSTLAAAAVDALHAQNVRPLLLDGDIVRKTLESPEETMLHDRSRRLQRARRLASLARMAATQGVPVIVATISLFHEVQRWNRSGPAPYGEVLLLADLDTLKSRNPQLYGGRGHDAEADVVGLNIVPEFPVAPDLVVNQHFRRASLPEHVREVVALYERLSRRCGSA